MLGTDFISYVSNMQVATYVGVEDFADKFNFIVTVMVFLMCTTIVTVKQYILKPISCYIATEVGGKNLLDYVENYCWVQGTIPISYTGNVPENENEWKKLEKDKLLYYQWVPFVLGLQCVLFYLPRVIWKIICYNRTGTDLEHLVSLANEAVRANSKNRSEIVKHLANSLEQLLFQRCAVKNDKAQQVQRRHHNFHPNNSRLGNASIDRQKFHNSTSLLAYFRSLIKYRSTMIIPAYFCVKLLYLVNSIGQLFLMQAFLGFGWEEQPYGLRVLVDMIAGRDWQITLIFPRVAFCYAKVKNLGARDNAVTAQCALPVNMLNEKIYVFLWWWVLLTACLTFLSILVWLSRMFGRITNLEYVTKSLRISTGMPIYKHDVEEDDIWTFAHKFLRKDGIFLVRIIAANAGDLIARDLLRHLYTQFKLRQNNTHVDILTNHTLEKMKNFPPTDNTRMRNNFRQNLASENFLLEPINPSFSRSEV